VFSKASLLPFSRAELLDNQLVAKSKQKVNYLIRGCSRNGASGQALRYFVSTVRSWPLELARRRSSFAPPG
jgi:hypothetical protein